MFDKKFTEFLEEKLAKNLPEYQKRNKKLFTDLGFDSRNEDFVEFWTVYSDEIYGTEGHLDDLATDLSDEYSATKQMRKDYNLPDNYFSFLGSEFDDFLFYDKNTDEVFFVDASHIFDFIETRFFDKKWDSFIVFIKEFLQYHD